MELRDHYDVVIVGSGPAGAGTARALTGSGMSVLIAERFELPRFKMCSGILFPSGRKFVAEHFGPIPAKVLCSPERVRGTRVYPGIETPCFDAPFAVFDADDLLETEGLNTSRSELDYWLCCQSDAQIMAGHSFDDFERDGRGYLVHLLHEERRLSVGTRFLVGADGTLSPLRKRAFPGFDDSVGFLPNYEEFYLADIDLEPGWLHLFLDRSITGYFATVFHDEGRIQVVTGVRSRESVREYFQAFRSHLEARHGLVVEQTLDSHGIGLSDMSAQKNYCLGSDNLLLVGEAGGFLRGGEGITSALTSGKAAGEAILESVASGRPAIEHFRQLAAEELRICETVHERLETALGFNVFKRPPR